MNRILLLEADGHLTVLSVDELGALIETAVGKALVELESRLQRAQEFATLAEAAERLRCDEDTVKARIVDGTLPAVDVADPSSSRRHWRIDLSKAARIQPAVSPPASLKSVS